LLPDNIHLSDYVQNNLQIEKCLLSPRSCYFIFDEGEDGFNICSICHKAISQGYRPKFCIANNYCFGTPPKCLTCLTEIERAVITPVKTFGYCFSYTGGQHIQLQGSLSYFKMAKEHIIEAMGTVAASNANIVVLLHGEVTKQQYRIAKEKNKVNMDKILLAIQWLIDNNYEWKTFKVDNNFNVYDYVLDIQEPKVIDQCLEVNDDDKIIETQELFHMYYPDGDFTKSNGGQENILELQSLVQEATENCQDIACKLDILKKSVYDYKDNNLVNSCLLQFAYGRGGMHENRLKRNGTITTSIDIQQYIEYLSLISQPHFQEGLFQLIMD
jgi:hypothetical protein